MHWRCPACMTLIEYRLNEDRPRPGVIYRCSVCHLELVLDEGTQRLTVAPLVSDSQPEPRR